LLLFLFDKYYSHLKFIYKVYLLQVFSDITKWWYC